MKLFNLLSKFIFLLRRQKLVVVLGDNRHMAKEMISLVSTRYLGRKILVWESDLEDLERLKFSMKNSSLPILVVTDGRSFSSEKTKALLDIVSLRGFLVSNSDDEEIRQLKTDAPFRTLNFGFQPRADIQASDIHMNGDTNFKVNYKGNIVPIWLKAGSEKKHIYSALAAVGAGVVLDLNLVEISQALKEY